MAPISSMSSLSTSSSAMNTCCHCGSSANSLWNFSLPISRRGLFLQDSFFEQAHGLFNDAVREVLGRWSGSEALLTDRWTDANLCLSNNLSRYRQLRAQNLREENQAVTASDDASSHKIVLDVHDFMDGEVKVKVVGERELMVEGHTKTNKGDFAVSSQSFSRRFTLSDLTNMEAITSVMSSDGVLTITAPKIVNQATKECLEIPIQVEGAMNGAESSCASSSSQTASNTSTSTTNGELLNKAEECRCKSGRQEYETASSTVHHQNVRKVPIRINSTLVESESHTSEGNDSSSSTSNSKLEAKSEAENVMTKQAKRTEKSKEELLSNSQQIDNSSDVSRKTCFATDTNPSTMEQRRTESDLQTQNSSSSKVRDISTIPLFNSSFLPITRRGLFSSDSFFEDIRKDFENTVNETLRKWGETGVFKSGWGDANLRLPNNLSRYRQLRIHNLKEEDQAVTVTSDNVHHKIVLDVHDFMDGEVKVKVAGERGLVVEGHNKTKTGETSVSSLSFRRLFTLPHNAKMDEITSVMSSDGILTITASLSQKNQSKDEGLVIPIAIEGRQNDHTNENFGSISTSETVSGNTASTTNSKILKEEEKKRAVDECQEKTHQQKVTMSTLHESRPENEAEEKTMIKNIKESLKKVSQQYHEDVASQEKSKKVKTIPIQTSDTVTEAAEQYSASEETERLRHQSALSSSQKSNLITQSKNSEDRHTVSESSNFFPVTTRGLFFSDSFFKDTWKDFQDAVRDVVTRWGDRSSATDDMTCYRTLRTQDIKEEYQAAKTSEDESNFKIVVDVRNFTNGGEITVKAVKDRELVVEGRVEKEEDGSFYTKRFLRHFILPFDVCLESVSSVMSSDGVLTITAPKKPSTFRITEVKVPTTVDEGTSKAESISLSTDQTQRQLNAETQIGSHSQTIPIKVEGSTNSSTAAKTFHLENSTSRHSSSVTSEEVGDKREHIIPVQLDETQKTKTSEEKSFTTKNTNSQTTHKENDMFWGTKTVEQVNEMKDCKSGNETAADLDVLQEDIDRQATLSNTQTKTSDSVKAKVDKKVTCMNQQNQRQNVSSLSLNRSLPITMKGTFFNDSFFEESRKNFATAVRDVLKTKEGSSISDDITSYRRLRQEDLKLENQAVQVEENQHSLKIVMDVYDFIGGDVKVSVAGGKELVVEGRAQTQEGASSGATKTFLRRFSLPRFVDLDSITSAMSSDGVLTIVSQKLQQASEADAAEREMFTESQSRIDSHCQGGQAWAEKSEKKSAKESEGCSSRSMSSTYRSHQEYSSKKGF